MPSLQLQKSVLRRGRSTGTIASTARFLFELALCALQRRKQDDSCAPARYARAWVQFAVVIDAFGACSTLVLNLVSGTIRPGTRPPPAPPDDTAGRPPPPERAGAASKPVRQKLRPHKGRIERARAAPPSCPGWRADDENEGAGREALVARVRVYGRRGR